VDFDVSVIDVEPAVWFDYGYRQSPEDPVGAGPGAGKFYAQAGETLVLAPVRFLLGYDRTYQDTGVSYAWSVSSGSFSSPASGSGEFLQLHPHGSRNLHGKRYGYGQELHHRRDHKQNRCHPGGMLRGNRTGQSTF
jgi:hypothetical protein